MKRYLYPAELKLTTILFGLAIFLCGCSSSYSVRSIAVRGSYTYGAMNEELKGQHVKTELKDGENIFAKEVKLSYDSLSWVDPWTEKKSLASIRQVSKIINKNHILGFLEGLGFGLIGGVGVFAVVLGINGRGGHESEVGILPAFMIFGGAGGGIGLILGSAIGHSYNYEFPETEQSDSLRNGK